MPGRPHYFVATQAVKVGLMQECFLEPGGEGKKNLMIIRGLAPRRSTLAFEFELDDNHDNSLHYTVTQRGYFTFHYESGKEAISFIVFYISYLSKCVLS